MRMNTEVKAKLLTALRSGEYSQTRHTLCSIDKDGKSSFCCLGVATDLFLKEIGEEWVKYEEYGNAIGYADSDKYLPEPVREWAEMAGSNPRFQIHLPLMTETLYRNSGDRTDYIHVDLDNGWDNSTYYLEMTLASLNDSGFTFEQIADVIEYAL